MKAKSTGQERDIVISNEEMKKLSEILFIGKTKRFSDDVFHREIYLEISLGKNLGENMVMDSQTTSERVYYEQAKKYNIIISELNCARLYEIRSAAERLSYNQPICKIKIRVMD